MGLLGCVWCEDSFADRESFSAHLAREHSDLSDWRSGSANRGGLRHPCIACIEPQASIVIMRGKNGESVLRENGGQYKYCEGHWRFMMTHSPAGTVFEIELL